MDFHANFLKVIVYLNKDLTEVVAYESQFEGQLCIGEVIRNCCVNMGIDPDTVDGITRNITVYRKSSLGWTLWQYNPLGVLSKTCELGCLEMKFE